MTLSQLVDFKTGWGYRNLISCDQSTMPLLKVLSGDWLGKIIELQANPIIVGRHTDCDIRIVDETVSRRHARIVPRNDGFFVEDLGSRNGTFLNGHKITALTRLSNRDTVSISDMSVEFRDDAAKDTADEICSPTVNIASRHTITDDWRGTVPFETLAEIDLLPGQGTQKSRDAETRLKAVLQITRYLRSSLELEEVLSHIVDCVANIFPQYSRAYLFRTDAETGRLVPAIVKQPGEDETSSMTMQPVVSGLVKQVLREGKAVLSIDKDHDADHSDSIHDAGNRSFMCAPLVGPATQVAGILYIETHNDRRRFTQEDLELFACVAILAGQAVEQAELFGARYRAVVDNAVDGIVTINENGMIESVNDAVVELFGYDESELSGKHFGMLMTDLERERHASAIAEKLPTILEQLTGDGHEVQARKKDGKTFPIYLSVGAFEFDGRRFYTGIVHDVSERHRAEAALRQMNETLEQQVRERTESVRLLQDVAIIANQSESIEEAFRTALVRVFQYRPYDAAQVLIRNHERPGEFADTGIWLPDEDSRSRKLMATASKHEFHVDSGLIRRTLAASGPIWEASLSSAFGAKLGSLANACGYRSVLACPVLIGSEVAAIVQLLSCDDKRPEPSFLEIMRHVGTQLGRVIERDALQRQLIDAVWDQHRRLGQELHDTLGQQLTGIGMFAGSLARHLKARELPEADQQAELVDMIQQAKTDVRQMTKVLYPVDVDAEGLVAALENLALAISERSQILCEFQGDRTIQFNNNEVATHLFRIAQEASHNAIKHAQPTQITISLTRSPGGISLLVADDGSGLGPSESMRGGGMGMRIMQYRANAIGAKLIIEPNKTGGTVVRCTLKRESKHAVSLPR